ncbi:Non-specific serine/threonine protein kinase [Bertholletia excelsa]
MLIAPEIVLLEMITGRPVVPLGSEDSHMVEWVASMIAKGDIRRIADPKLRSLFDANSMWRAVELVMACVSYSSIARPTMNIVVTDSKGCLVTESDCQKTNSKNPTRVRSMNQESEINPKAT